MKVVWICHFTNAEVQSLLPLWKKSDEFASWIPNILKGFEKRDDIEIYVISPHEYLRKDTHLKIRNIEYYFITYGIPFWHRHWPRFFRYDIHTGFRLFRKKTINLVNNIHPELINLHGAENAYYSSVALDLYKKYPVLVLLQGIISEYKNNKGLSAELRKRIKIEEEIFSRLYFFCGDPYLREVIEETNNDFQYFILDYPVNEDLAASTGEIEKKYDCLFFGRLTIDKGTGEFIKVIAELKKSLPDIKACMVGGGNEESFRLLAKQLGCADNIFFAGFLPSQKELFAYVKSSRVVIAPPLVERLSCTIRESMLLRVPVVAYATGAIPTINVTEENILIVDILDYKMIAKKTMMLLQNEEFSKSLSDKAYRFYMKNYSLEVSVNLFMEAYNSILNINN